MNKKYDLDPEGQNLPIKIDSSSNGEFFPQALSREERYANELAQIRVSAAAQKLNLPRRGFLKLSSAAACTLLAFNEAHARAGNSGGYFDIPPEAGLDNQLAAAVMGGTEFILDIQNHCVDPAATWRGTADGDKWYYVLTQLFPQRDKCGIDSIDCYSAGQLVKEVYLDSDTDMGVVSTLWGARAGNPTPIAYASEVKTLVDKLGMGKRALLHGGVLPNEEGALDYMDEQLAYGVSAWKLYPQWGPQGVGYFVDDPQIGIPVLEKARSLGVKVVCAHRGLPLPFLDYKYSHPADMARAAKLFPDLSFIVYHSGFEPGIEEGPYSGEDDRGINRLIKAHQDLGFKPNQGNLYAELGTTWRSVMSKPDQAAHVIGKLIKYFGEDRICWGTDSIWYGSPQDQIQAFRTFQVSAEFQEQFGYAKLTPEIRAKIFGFNAALPYGIDVGERLQARSGDALARLREDYRQDPNPAYRTWGPKTRRQFLRLFDSHDGRPG